MKCKGLKFKYKNKAKAMTAISRNRSRGLSVKRPYKCKACNCWHITSKKKRIYRLKKESPPDGDR